MQNGRQVLPEWPSAGARATPHAGSTPATLVARGLLLVALMMTRIGGWRGVVVGAAFTLLVAGLQAVGRARATPADPGELARDGGGTASSTSGSTRNLASVSIDELRGRVGVHEPLPGEP